MLTQCGDQHLRMSELADAALLTRSGMTRLVDRLEKQGLVRRERCAADGRGTYAVITPEGAARFAAARPTHIAGVRRLFLDPLKQEGAARARRGVRRRARRDLGPEPPRAPRLVYRSRRECAPRRNSQVGARPCRWRSRASACRPARARASSPRIAVCSLFAVAGAHAADAAARAPERLRHGRLLCALRGLPARPPEPRRPPALEPVRVLGPAVGRRSAVGRPLPAGARRLRPPRARDRDGRRSSRSTTCSRRSRRTRSRACSAPAGWARSTRASRSASRGYLLARSQALGLLTGAAWLAASVAAAQYAVHREGRGASPLVLAGALALSILGGSQQLTAVAATSALVVLVLQLRWRGLAIFAGAGARRARPRRRRAAAAARARLALDRRRTASSTPRASARSAGPTRSSSSARSGRTPASSRRSTRAR